MTDDKVSLKVIITEGSAGCLAEIKEFGIRLGMPKRTQVLGVLDSMVANHCHTLDSRGATSQATPIQLELARRAIRNGFELIF